jgi:hypothetical protein
MNNSQNFSRSKASRYHKGLGWRILSLLFVALVSLSGACGGGISSSASNKPAQPVQGRGGTTTLTPFQPIPPTQETGGVPSTPETSPSSTPTTAPASLWVAPYLPEALQGAIHLPPGIVAANSPDGASLRLDVGNDQPVSSWVYALVAPFPTIPESVSFKALQRSWKGDSAGPFSGNPILMDENTLRVFSILWGNPAEGAVKTFPADKLLDKAWNNRPSWAIVPFEALQPRWKVLEVDGQSPVRKEFDASKYPLVAPISLVEVGKAEDLFSSVKAALPATNRDSNRLTTVVLTGVTALVRATAYLMERDGITHPAEYIGDWLRNADITHISNEIPFSPNCPFPDPQQAGLRFCSRTKYIKLLEDVGTDVVELTGDHFADWGSDATLYTIQMYKDRNWPYYGGGINLADGRKAVKFEHNGNKIAFVGCNAKGGGYATASATTPGAVACGDKGWILDEIKQLKKEGYLVIATFQHIEIYDYKVPQNMRDDFEAMAKAGAVIVSGSQAHQPHGMEFDGQAFLHFGLGNLFFDQYRYLPGPETDRAFVDRHIFYGGKYISTELLPMYFVDLAHARPMSNEEKQDFLQTIFGASGW